MTPPMLLAVPNVSEGRDETVIEEIARALRGPAGSDAGPPDSRSGRSESAGVRLLDVHSDRDHNRSVFTLAGPPRELSDALLCGAEVAVRTIDVMSAGAPRGQHPHVGALDVAPIVYLEQRTRGAACAEALLVADRIGSELDLPVFLYGQLGGGRTRAELRRGGVRRLGERLAGTAAATSGADEPPLRPDFGPARLHPSAGAALVAAREPLVAFNVRLGAESALNDAQAIAAELREGGAAGVTGLRAIAVALGDGHAQVSMNVERPLHTPLAQLVGAIAERAPVDSAEIVGLAPARALEGFPEEVPLLGFDPARHLIENALGLSSCPKPSDAAGPSTAATPPG